MIADIVFTGDFSLLVFVYEYFSCKIDWIVEHD